MCLRMILLTEIFNTFITFPFIVTTNALPILLGKIQKLLKEAIKREISVQQRTCLNLLEE